MIIDISHASLRQQLRRLIRQRRRALTAEQQRQFSRQAADRMMTYPPVVAAQTVALFLSFDGELDTSPLIDRLWQAGKQVCLPRLHPCSRGQLLFLRYHPGSTLIRNRFAIAEPRLDVRDVVPLSHIDVLVVPLVAFDAAGQRLGMGAVIMIAHCKTGSSIVCNLSAMLMIVSM